MSIAFDTHAFVKRMIAVGFTEPQAEVLAEEQAKIIDERLSTKEDLAKVEATLKSDLAKVEATLKHDILEAKTDILKWLVPLLIGQAALIATLVKLL